jgi:flagellar biosynthesis protein FlhF
MTQNPEQLSSPQDASAETTGQVVRYRAVVGSAAEAVTLVRERFGSGARVVSVRQIEAGGLTRFLQKPRLEVIIEVGAGNKDTVSAETPKSKSPSPEPARANSERPAFSKTGVASSAVPERREANILKATGIDELLLERIRSDHSDIDWESLPAHETLGRLALWLRQRFSSMSTKAPGPRRVFLGSCGAGKTTALCKGISVDVFVEGRQTAILKLDGDQPNASDGLAAFCDVLGAPLLRSPSEIEEFDQDSLLYIDVPGVGLDAPGEHSRLAQTLDALDVDTRVLVINAALETEVIADSFEMGRACGATHVVFTHLDEVRRPGKLWRFVLFGGLHPWFVSSGPSPAGEMEKDVFDALLARTFPPMISRTAGVEGGRA